MTCSTDRALACDVVDWFALRFGDGAWKHVNSLHRTISSARNDRSITHVNLTDAPLHTDALFELKRLTGLTGISLHGRQMGRGLDAFRNLSTLKYIGIAEATTGQLSELRRLPQLEYVSLWKPQTGQIGMEALADLPQLKSLDFGDCRVTAELLAAMPVLTKVESFVLTHCSNFESRDLRHLKRLPALKFFDVVCQSEDRNSLNDMALEHLSQLEHLETLALRTPWTAVTDDGLKKLARLKSLKTIYLWRIQCTPERISRLQQAVPNCTLVY